MLNVPWFNIDSAYLQTHRDHVFVYGAAWKARDGGAAKLRSDPNTHPFITKREACNDETAFFELDDYQHYFEKEMVSLIDAIETYPNKTFIISKVGAGLANRHCIFEKIIQPQLPKLLEKYPNVWLLGW